LRQKIILLLGYRFDGWEFEEMLLYSMVSNSELFNTAMMRYQVKQLYKKFIDVIEIPHLGHLDLGLKQNIIFYAKFLALYAAKMKRD
jgi:hypothetical protein